MKNKEKSRFTISGTSYVFVVIRSTSNVTLHLVIDFLVDIYEARFSIMIKVKKSIKCFLKESECNLSGRASRSHRGGRRFEPCNVHQQRDIVSSCLIFKEKSEDVKNEFAEYTQFIINPFQRLNVFK